MSRLQRRGKGMFCRTFDSLLGKFCYYCGTKGSVTRNDGFDFCICPECDHKYISYESYLSEEDMRSAAEVRLQTPGRYRKSFTCIHVLKSTIPRIRAEIDWK